jgi:predicted Zn-dependent protease with MMP-like domain
MKMKPKEFERLVRIACRRIPPGVRDKMENVVITVRRRPTLEMLSETGFSADEQLLGLYWGTPRPERTFFDPPPLYPDTIYIFQEPLEEMCENVEELIGQIEITVVHEIAHFLGIDEKRIEELGYG